MNKVIDLIPVILFLIYTQPDSNRSIINPFKNSFSEGISNNIQVDKKNNSALKQSREIVDTILKRKTDTTLLLKIATEILKTIKKSDFTQLASFVHPKYGVRFSPYANIDTFSSRVLSSTQLIQIAKQNKRINWHSSWSDSGNEFLTIGQYFKKFVYDADFLNASVKSVNKFHSHGTDLNNINEVYPKCDVVEFYFSGFEEKYGGMDFRGLRLVLRLYKKKLYLIAIVHDEWTP